MTARSGRHDAAVVGGAAAPPAWDFTAALLRPGSGSVFQRQFCGGSLVAPQWVLTAAHCVDDIAATPAGLQVLIGRLDLEAPAGGELHQVSRIVVHPGWSSVTESNDVALVQLRDRSSIEPIPLMAKAAEPVYNDTDYYGLVAGWGAVNMFGDVFPAELQRAEVPIWSDGFCGSFYGAYIPAQHVCAGSSATSACFGDSGGPLLGVDNSDNVALVGVVSFGPSLCTLAPGVFTQVSTFEPWIRSFTAQQAINCATGAGYWLLGRDGGVFSLGAARFYGSTGNMRLNQPVVGMTRSPSGLGYWFVAADGGIFAYGPNAGFFGSTGSLRLAQPIVGMAATPTGKGYWLVARDGGLFAFGDAGFFGARGGKATAPVVGMAATPTGRGYWIAANDGSIFAFGDAKFFGSAAGRAGNSFVSFAAKPDGSGYWLVTRDGAVHAFGTAAYKGGRNGKPTAPIVGIASSISGAGYRLVASDGAVYAYGASSCGGMSGRSLSAPIVAIATAP